MCMEYLEKIKREYPLPEGYQWKYWYQKSYLNPYDGWDRLEVIDESGHTVEYSIIHGLRDYYQWTRTAERTLKTIHDRLEDEKFRKEMMNPTVVVEDLGERNTDRNPTEEMKSITSEGGESNKRKWFW